MNPATADEFSRCTVTTKVSFNSPDWGPLIGGDEAGFVKWSATAPGVDAAASTNAFGVGDFKYMQVPKTSSDIIFSLKKGDLLSVRGVSGKNAAQQVVFYALEIVKAAAP